MQASKTNAAAVMFVFKKQFVLVFNSPLALWLQSLKTSMTDYRVHFARSLKLIQFALLLFNN